MVAVWVKVLAFVVKLQLNVPSLLPLDPDVIESQLPPVVTVAVQGMVPGPDLDTLNVVVPASLATLHLAGLTEITE